MSPQSKMEHLISLVQEYKKDFKTQEETYCEELQSRRMRASFHKPMSFEGLPTIKPKAELYLERIEAFLESAK